MHLWSIIGLLEEDLCGRCLNNSQSSKVSKLLPLCSGLKMLERSSGCVLIHQSKRTATCILLLNERFCYRLLHLAVQYLEQKIQTEFLLRKGGSAGRQRLIRVLNCRIITLIFALSLMNPTDFVDVWSLAERDRESWDLGKIWCSRCGLSDEAMAERTQGATDPALPSRTVSEMQLVWQSWAGRAARLLTSSIESFNHT